MVFSKPPIPTGTTVITNPSLDETPTFTSTIPVYTASATATSFFENDWKNGCISSQWISYPERIPLNAEQCFIEPLPGQIFIRNGNLTIIAQNDVSTAKEYGIFTPIPQSGTIRLLVDLNHLEKAELWIGIFSGPKLDTDGVLIVVPYSPPAPVRGQDTKERAFAIRSMPLQNQKFLTKIYKDVDGIYQLGFDITSGTVAVVTEGDVLDPIAMSYKDRWLFIGYRSLIRKSDIDASFKDLIIEEN